MDDSISLLFAFLAGVVSFISPCILPVIPSYLSLIGGVSYQELTEGSPRRWGTFINTLLFIAGFSVVFIVLGALLSSAGAALGGISTTVNRIAGIVVIVLGLNFIFDFWRILNIERRFHFQKRPPGAVGSGLLGMAFGAGWTPCIGPILASILFLAGTTGSVGRGVLLLAVYSAGLGTPFLLAGLFFSRFQSHLDRIKPHLKYVKIAGGAFLVFLGVFIFLGNLTQLYSRFFAMAAQLERWGEAYPLGPRLVVGVPLAFLSLLVANRYLRTVRARRAERVTDGLALYVLPGRLTLLVLLAAGAVLAMASRFGVLEVLSWWLTFQGI